MTVLDAKKNLANTRCCHRERSSRTMRTAQSKHLRLLLSLLVLFLTATYSQAQKTTAPRFNGTAAYNITAELLKVAPKRFNGSPGHVKAEEFIKQHFAPEAAKGNLETDTFTANTPA